jgi:hypothetical protein
VSDAPRLRLKSSINAMLSARSVEANIYRTETIFSQRKFASKGSVCCELFHREQQEADVVAAPSGMLDRRALVAASGAPRTPSKLVTRSVRAPTDHGDSARQRRAVLALLAPYPYPRRRALQVAERRPRSGLLPLGSWPAATRQPPRHGSGIETGRIAAHGASVELSRLKS